MIAPKNTSAKVETRKHGRKLIVIASLFLVVLVAAVLVATSLTSGKKRTIEDKIPKPSAKIKDATPALPVATPVVEKPTVSPIDPNKHYEDGVEVIAENVRTNSSGAVIEKLILADGRKISKIHPPKPLFDNPADQVIALAISTKPGQSMPPLPDISNIDKDFADSLLAPIKINDDDPDDVKELKAKVMETKAYLIDEVKNGGSVYEALMAHQKEMETIADSHLMAIQELQKIKAEDGVEMAREFAERVNESFRIRGIPEIPVPGDNNSRRNENE